MCGNSIALDGYISSFPLYLAPHVEEVKTEIKTEKPTEEKPTTNGSMKPPPEKKQKLR